MIVRRLRKDVVKEKHEGVVAGLPRLAQSLAETHLAAPVGGEIFDQQRASALVNVALDARVAAETFRLLADILHRQHQPVGEPGRVGDASRLAAGDDVEPLIADLALDRRHREVDEPRAQARIGDDLAHVGIDRTGPARGEDERLFRVEQNGLHFDQHFRGLPRDDLLFGRRRFHRSDSSSVAADALFPSLSARIGQVRRARHSGISLTAPFETDRCVT